ncbi:MAG: YegS/Rv2252/BmrU family lipid kinase [Ruminiclostridium sp.]|nr:YegS/Rv2252/BmrU family lipid kinase [Ruminiclostridium sp.]
MKKLLFVYNPHSGKGAIGQSLSEIICRFTDGGYDVTVHPTREQRDGQNYIRDHAGEYDTVVASGGDGMLHEMFCGFHEAGIKMPCGYIPAGTVNDFASSLKIPKVPEEAADIIVAGNFKELDAGLFNDTVFSYVAAFGMFTKVSYATDQKMKNALGAAAYFIEVLKSLDPKSFRDSTVRAKISFGGEVYEDDFIYGMVCNTLSVGTLTGIVPQGAKMDDGLLEGVFIKAPKNLPELDSIRNALVTGNLDIPGIIYSKSSAFTVETERETEWTLDGEYGGSHTLTDIRVKEKAVIIAVPADK